MLAYEFIARDQAGLVMCGVEDNQIQWLGSFQQWQEAGKIEREYELSIRS